MTTRNGIFYEKIQSLFTAQPPVISRLHKKQRATDQTNCQPGLVIPACSFSNANYHNIRNNITGRHYDNHNPSY